jgi:hypothetical protein
VERVNLEMRLGRGCAQIASHMPQFLVQLRELFLGNSGFAGRKRVYPSGALLRIGKQMSDNQKESAMPDPAAKPEQVRVTLRAPASLVRSLERLALAEDRSLSAEIRRLMRLHVETSGGVGEVSSRSA